MPPSFIAGHTVGVYFSVNQNLPGNNTVTVDTFKEAVSESGGH